MIRSRCKCGRKLMFPEGASIKMVCRHCDSKEFTFEKRVVSECRNAHRVILSANHVHDMTCDKCKKDAKLAAQDNMSRLIWEIRKDEDFVDDAEQNEQAYTEEEEGEEEEDKEGIKVKSRKRKK